MPKIPTYDAPGRSGGVPRASAQVQLPDNANLGTHLARTADAVGDIAKKLKDQSDDSDVVEMRGQYEAGRHDIETNLKQDPEVLNDPATYGARFEAEGKKLIENVMKTSNSQVAQARFGDWMNLHFPVHAAVARAEGQALVVDNERGRLANSLHVLSMLVGDATTIDERDDYLARGRMNIDKAKARGLVTGVQAQHLHETFEVKSSTNFMRALSRNDSGSFEELEKTGMFNNVPEPTRSIIRDSYFTRRAAEANRLRTEMTRIQTAWAKDVGVETVMRLRGLAGKPELDEAFLIENKDAYTPDQFDGYIRSIRDKRAGIGTGDPKIEALMSAAAHNNNLNPQSTLDMFHSFRANGTIGLEVFLKETPHLEARIRADKADKRADRNESRTITNENEARIREINSISYHAAMRQADEIFHVTGPFEKINNTAQASRTQLKMLIDRDSNHLTGDKDSLALLNFHLPAMLNQAQTAYDQHTQGLQAQIRGYNTKADLDAALANGQINKTTYDAKLHVMSELLQVWREHARLENVKRRLSAPGGPK